MQCILLSLNLASPENIQVIRKSQNIALPPSVLYKWADEDATDSRRLQDGDIYHEWFVAYLKVWTGEVKTLFPGYLVVIHDLDLISMSEDLAGFKPNMYRLMQLSGKVVLSTLTL